MASWPFMGADIPRSTLIDWCGQAAAAVRPVANLIRANLIRAEVIRANLIRAEVIRANLIRAEVIRAEVMATDRLHADDTGAHAHSRMGMGSRHADPRARPEDEARRQGARRQGRPHPGGVC